MVTSRKVLVSAAAAFAVCALPIKFDPATGSGLSAASAYAKSENGGGNDKGGGSDRGNGGDRGRGDEATVAARAVDLRTASRHRHRARANLAAPFRPHPLAVF